MDKVEYMTVYYHQNARQSYNIKIANNALENVAKFRYLRTTVTNQNYMYEEIEGK
jgi:hypothetical protein